jgi:hypothetical protein
MVLLSWTSVRTCDTVRRDLGPYDCNLNRIVEPGRT